MAISLGNKAGGASRGRMPSKRSINFAEVGKERSHYWSALPVVAVLLVIAAVVAKIGIYDRLQVVSAEEAKTVELQTKLDQANAKIESFGSLTEQYAQYTYSGMTDAEVTMADRVEVLDLINTYLIGQCTVESWELSGNDLVVNVLTDGNELRHITMLTNNMTADPRVEIADVSAGQSFIVTSTEEGEEPQNMTTGKIKVKLVKKEVNKG